MPKIAYISPKLLIDKVTKLVKGRLPSPHPQPKSQHLKPTHPQEELPDWAKAPFSDDLETAQEENDDFLQEESSRLQISLQDLKLMHTALMHFQKYLKAKGQMPRAQEVAALHQKLDSFIQEKEAL